MAQKKIRGKAVKNRGRLLVRCVGQIKGLTGIGPLTEITRNTENREIRTSTGEVACAKNVTKSDRRRRRRRIHVPDTYYVRSTCGTRTGRTMLRSAIGHFQYCFYTFRKNHLFKRNSRNPLDESLNIGARTRSQRTELSCAGIVSDRFDSAVRWFVSTQSERLQLKPVSCTVFNWYRLCELRALCK